MTVEEVIGTLFQGEDQQLIQSLISISVNVAVRKRTGYL